MADGDVSKMIQYYSENADDKDETWQVEVGGAMVNLFVSKTP
jgi:hypothetical protein